MKFNIITIFPELFDSYLKTSLIGKARENNLLKVKVHNLRDWTNDKHNTVDDKPFGGGLGMVMKVGPIYRAVKEVKKKNNIDKEKQKVVLFTPRGKKYNQKKATEFSNLENIIMICGRYEGVDQRVAEHIADLELSIGNYDLMGGELPAMIVLESTARLIPGVIGKEKILDKRVTEDKKFIEYPQYTRPKTFKTKDKEKWEVPEVLLSGHHKKIEKWRKEKGEKIG